jgi:hypothetical protein
MVVCDTSDLSHGLTLESKWKLISKTPTGQLYSTHKSKHVFSEHTQHSFDCRCVSSSHEWAEDRLSSAHNGGQPVVGMHRSTGSHIEEVTRSVLDL